ncbi:peptidylprolyl isomerase [Paenibacillus sp. MWE-103]|uniref:Peptidylprolyl isomerase n=1 Tax=Paenibacillus artemisiicola TaxID=1172618 RepID=A0ABS3WIA1_9BACL|nr:peptidylprolyl isomerase [Paenibacillus artemisiicola]MBO7748054.1 peptidylprolyl isomerase [Paenibacillus artemisiicola]
MLRINQARRTILLALVAVLVVVLAAGCGSKKEEASAPGAGGGKTIATYKDGTVTEGEFKKYSTFFGIVQPQTEMYLSIPQLQEQFLREYIGYKILYKPLADKKLSDEDQKSLDTFYTQVKQQIDSDETLKKKVDDAGLKEADIRYYYTMITSIMKDEESKTTDAEVKKQFDDTKADYNVISVRHILIATADPNTGAEKRTDEEALKIAKEVKGKLDAGGDWAALAKQYSDDTGSKDNGGLYADQQAKGWVQEFKDAANKQEIGKIGDPVKSQFGYHVMKVEKRTETTFDKLTDADKESIKQEAASAKLNAFMTTDLPKLITKIDLPKTETPADGSGAGTNSGTNPGAGTNTDTSKNGSTNTDTSKNGTTNTEKKDDATTNDTKTDGK